MASERQKNSARGKAWEKRIKEYLESIGYTVDRARPILRFIGPPPGRWISTPNDILGVADLVAVRKDKPYTLFVQATLDAAIGRKQEKLLTVGWNPAQRVLIWTKAASIQSGARVFRLCHDSGQWTEYIFRMRTGEPAPMELL